MKIGYIQIRPWIKSISINELSKLKTYIFAPIDIYQFLPNFIKKSPMNFFRIFYFMDESEYIFCRILLRPKKRKILFINLPPKQ